MSKRKGEPLPCPCCGKTVFGEWTGKTCLDMGWVKGEYTIFCHGCGLRMVASANVKIEDVDNVQTMAVQAWNTRMIPPAVWQLLRRVGAFLIENVTTDKARTLHDRGKGVTMIKLVLSLVLVAVSGCWTIPVANPGPVSNRIVLRRGESVSKTVWIGYKNPRKNVISFDTED